jgi:O-antigen ligase
VLAVVLATMTALFMLVLAPIPTTYIERLKTIRTYEEIGETSALARFHFWEVAVDMAIDHPLGIGLNNYEYLYDAYDSTDGLYGRARAVHNSFLEVLAEAGFAGAAIWLFMFATALLKCWRIRQHAARSDLPSEDQRFFATYANAMIASMAGFTVAGSFIALALNDLTWLTFAFVAALDRLSVNALAEAVRKPIESRPRRPGAVLGGAWAEPV